MACVNFPSAQPVSVEERLFQAIELGNVDAVRLIGLNEATSKMQIGPDVQSPLLVACQLGQQEIAQLLLEACKSSIDDITATGDTPVHAAAKYGHVKIVKMLHLFWNAYHRQQQLESICLVANSTGSTPLHFAAAQGHLPVVQYLLLEASCDPNHGNCNGQTAFHLAAKYGHVGILQILVEFVSKGMNALDTATVVAEHSTDQEYVQVAKDTASGSKGSLAASDQQLHQRGKHTSASSTPNKGNVNSDYPGAIKQDESKGMGSNAKPIKPSHETKLDGDAHTQQPRSPLPREALAGEQAVQSPRRSGGGNENPTILTRLCPPGFLDSYRDNKGNSLLHVATAHGQLAVVQFLIGSLKCNPNLRNEDGRTALHLAVKQGNIEIVRYLTEEGCDCMDGDEYGRTPLYFAAETGQLTIVKHLSEQEQSDFSVKTTGQWEEGSSVFCAGRTPLHAASQASSLEVVQFLVEEQDCSPSCTDAERKSPLHLACREGHKMTAKYLIEDQRLSPSCLTSIGRTPLHFAAEGGHTDLVKYLAEERQCNPKCQDDDNIAPLHLASAQDHLETVRYLVNELHCSPNEKGKKGKTPLHYASQCGHMDVVSFLVEEQEVDPFLQSDVDTTLLPPLQLAIKHSHAEVVRYFVEKKVGNVTHRDGRSLLHDASLGGSLAIVKFFVDEKCCIPVERDQQDRVPLHYASKGGHLEVVKYLIKEKRVSASPQDVKNATPLHLASEAGRSDVVCYLAEEQHCDLLCVDANGNTPLHYAAIGGQLSIIRYLVHEKKCSPEIKNRQGRTPLHYASQAGHSEVVKCFLDEFQVDVSCTDENGETALHLTSNVLVAQCLVERCDPKQKDMDGNTPLHSASRSGSLDVAKYLITQKCNPMERGFCGRTPLHYASESGNLSVVHFLVDQRLVDLKCTDDNGFTPLHLASKNGRVNIIQYLVGEKGCDPCASQSGVKSPFTLAVHNAQEDIILYLLSKCSIDVKKSYDHLLQLTLQKYSVVSPSVKVFLVGNRSAGKSTLTKTLQIEDPKFAEKVFPVKGVSLETAGIITVDFKSKTCGKITLYDFAGHEEYYGSHEALFESTSNPVVLIVVDLKKSEDEIKSNIHYWLALISNGVTYAATQAGVILVGSHYDSKSLKKAGVLDRKKAILVSFMESPSLRFKNVQVVGWVIMDCRMCASQGMSKLRQLLGESCTAARFQSESYNSQAYSLHTFLTRKLPHRDALTFSQLFDAIVSVDDEHWNLLKEPTSLYRACESLNATGAIILLKNAESREQSWVILQKDKILSEVHGIFKNLILNPLSSIGVIPWSLIGENPSLVVEYMLKNEFCSEIDRKYLGLVEGLVRANDQERHFFFPDLTRAVRPVDVLYSGSEFDYSFGWVLKCASPDSSNFFTPRFRQLLLVQLVCEFAFSAYPQPLSTRGPNQGCVVWKNGIRWRDPALVEALVEVTGQYSAAVVVVLKCIKGDFGSEMRCIQLRSQLILKVLSLKARCCSELQVTEHLILPHCLSQYPPQPADEMLPMTKIASAIVNMEPSIVLDSTAPSCQLPFTRLNDLLLFEPFLDFGGNIPAELFDIYSSREVISDDTLQALSLAHKDTWKRLAIVLGVTQGIIEEVDATGTTTTEFKKCRIILDRWSETKRTYYNLCCQLSSYSIFAGRKPKACLKL